MTNGFLSPLRTVHCQTFLPNLDLFFQQQEVFPLVLFYFGEKRPNNSDSHSLRNENAMIRLEDIRVEKAWKEVDLNCRFRYIDCVSHVTTLESFIAA